MLRALTVVLLLLLALSCSRRRSEEFSGKSTTPDKAALLRPVPVTPTESPGFDDPGNPYTKVLIHHVVFREKSGLKLRAEWLRGRLYPTRQGVIPSFDDPTSFKVEIEDGKTSLALNSLASLLTPTLLKGSQLSKVRISARGRQEVQINAVLHKVVPLPIQVTGQIGTTHDGRLSIQVRSIKVLHIPMGGLLHAVKVDAADLVHLANSKAIELNGDSIYIRTEDLLPAPRKQGVVTSVHFTPEGDLVEEYGHDRSDNPTAGKWPGGRWHNYMQLEGGTIRFGRLTMDHADLVLIDKSPGDWFEFDLARYKEQIVAGDMHMTPSGGLQVLTPDITKIHARAEAATPGEERPAVLPEKHATPAAMPQSPPPL